MQWKHVCQLHAELFLSFLKIGPPLHVPHSGLVHCQSTCTSQPCVWSGAVSEDGAGGAGARRAIVSRYLAKVNLRESCYFFLVTKFQVYAEKKTPGLG